MTSASSARAFEPRHLQLARAAFAAIAAAMITFSPDHSAEVGLSVFSGFAIATGLSFVLAAWLVYPAGGRGVAVLLGALSVVAGMIAGIVGLRSVVMFFALTITWALVTGLIETIVGWRARRALAAAASPAERAVARDHLTIGILTLVLGLALLFVSPQYALQYDIAETGQAFTLTGITIAVGVFGGYTAIVAVFLAIAGFSPRVDAAGVVEASENRDGGAGRPADEAPGGIA